ncbi:hypothetical protein DFH07DRAFT_799401 [Mycena maculata]|uniref:Uncharacterized protein n=1 Tax=Mycena maculata TaxID=230809 RepID=A0AAD7NUK6_9AGAR|nr:hypothetical protein DFH07DRAFT_799401 [Mycena maculata]
MSEICPDFSTAAMKRPHPCYENPDPKSQLKPNTTCTLKYIKMRPDGIPANYPYLTPKVPGLYANKGVHEHLPVPFFEFRGPGAPPPDLGAPGDVYIDLTPAAHVLYARAEEQWCAWPGPAAALDDLLGHPHFVDCTGARYLWVHPRDGVEWVCVRTVMRRQQALRAAGILTAARLIGDYLRNEATPVKRSPAKRPRIFSKESDAESEAELSDAFYPSKRARIRASGNSASAKSTVSARRPKRPSPDRQLEDELADGELQELRTQKRGLMTAVEERAAGGRAGRAAAIIQMLKKEYTGSCNPAPIPTADEARQRLPDLRCRVDEGLSHVFLRVHSVSRS